MIYQDISSSNTQMHLCTVERVYNSGLIDARSTRDKFFEQVNSTFFAAEGNYTVGDRCIVISDGSQHIVLGQINEPFQDSSGSTSIKNINNDLADLTNAKALVATDKFGSQAKVVAAPGGGVIADSGGNALIHLDPGHDRIREVADRKETFTIPFYADLDHDGVTASSKYKWRTLADGASWDRDMARERSDALDLGGILTVDVGPSPDVISIEYKLNGATLSKIEINPLGEISVKGPGDIANIDVTKLGVELTTTAGQVSVDLGGRIKIGNKSGIDLLDLLDQALAQLGAATTITIFGPSPLVNSPVFLSIKALLAAIKG